VTISAIGSSAGAFSSADLFVELFFFASLGRHRLFEVGRRPPPPVSTCVAKLFTGRALGFGLEDGAAFSGNSRLMCSARSVSRYGRSSAAICARSGCRRPPYWRSSRRSVSVGDERDFRLDQPLIDAAIA
jgi:hypothetical protein